MSSIDMIGGTTRPPSASVDGFAALTSEEFVRIMFTELTNQDPFEPNDSQALLSQLSSLRSIQSDMEMMNRLEKLVSQNEFATAAGLIGHLVSGLTEDGRRLADMVISVSQGRDGPVLNLYSGARMPLRNVDEIIGPLDLDDLDDLDDDDIPGDDEDDDIPPDPPGDDDEEDES